MKNIAPLLHRFPLGLRQRIILMFTIFTAIPLGLAGIFLYNHSISSAQKFMNNYIGQTTAALNIKIEVLFNDAISILNIVPTEERGISSRVTTQYPSMKMPSKWGTFFMKRGISAISIMKF